MCEQSSGVHVARLPVIEGASTDHNRWHREPGVCLGVTQAPHSSINKVSPNVRPVLIEDSPILQPTSVRAQGSRAGSEDTDTTIESPPLPPSWRTRATPLHVHHPTSTITQSTDSTDGRCGWIGCHFCPAATRDGFGGPYKGAHAPAPSIHPHPFATNPGRELGLIGASTAKKMKTSRRRFKGSGRGGSEKGASPTTGAMRRRERIGWSIYKQGGSYVSSQGLLATETCHNPSDQDERSEEFWEVAALLGLVRST